MDVITEERLEKYFSLSEEALAMAKENVNEGRRDDADVIIDMVTRYVADARHFLQKDDKVTAFAALNYAHGWLDCGARLGVFDVDDDYLFTVSGE